MHALVAAQLATFVGICCVVYWFTVQGWESQLEMRTRQKELDRRQVWMEKVQEYIEGATLDRITHSNFEDWQRRFAEANDLKPVDARKYVFDGEFPILPINQKGAQ